ncbi:unnamed protein product [Microthlaspi erraticum]|uniref:Uncharacterized protein n=1 Tax=Microthlaspi erraticum TaxID=1685480 RepID=A0A6D2JWW7_9BRAS|nr:unnamed protein product [Microthlaspi erraticum]
MLLREQTIPLRLEKFLESTTKRIEPDHVHLNPDASTDPATGAAAPTGRAPGANASPARTRSGNLNQNVDSSVGGNPYTWVRPEGRSNDHMQFNWPRRPKSNSFGQTRTDPNETSRG